MFLLVLLATYLQICSEKVVNCYGLRIQQFFFAQQTDFSWTKMNDTYSWAPGTTSKNRLSVTSCIVSEWDANCSSLSVQQILRACHKFCQQCYQLVEWKTSWRTLLRNFQCLGIYYFIILFSGCWNNNFPRTAIRENVALLQYKSLQISQTWITEDIKFKFGGKLRWKFWENRGKNFAKIEQKLLWK